MMGRTTDAKGGEQDILALLAGAINLGWVSGEVVEGAWEQTSSTFGELGPGYVWP